MQVYKIHLILILCDRHNTPHHGTVHNNLEPNHLACPKALDPNYCRQETLEFITVYGNELRLFWGQGIFLTHTVNIAHLT